MTSVCVIFLNARGKRIKGNQIQTYEHFHFAILYMYMDKELL